MARKVTPKKRRENTADWCVTFLRVIAQTANVREACKKAGVSRKVAYVRKESDPDFAAAWQSAMDDALDELEKAARARALKISDTLLIFLLKSHRRAIYGDRVALDHSNYGHVGNEARERLNEIDRQGFGQSGAPGGDRAPQLENTETSGAHQSQSPTSSEAPD